MLVNQKESYRSLTQQDYEAMAGPDWPTYDKFSQGDQIQEFMAKELDEMLGAQQEKIDQLSNFCVLPFYGFELPNNTHCCLLPNDYNINQIQKDMLNNRRNPQCNKCWTLEDAGSLSNRQIKNFTVDFYTNIDIVQLFNQAQEGKNSTIHYIISASNYCNFTCITCNSKSSTAWGELDSNSKVFPVNNVSLIDSINYSTAKFIIFTGGESTMIRVHWDILEKLIEHKNYECGISFVTNGSFKLTSRQQDLLHQLPYVNFCFSIDGTEKVFEYLRYPGKWSTLIENVKWAQDQGFDTSVSYTLSNLNILYHEHTIEWFKQHQLPYIENLVYSPEYFNPQALSQSIKEKILQQVKHPTVTKLLSLHTEQHDQMYQKFLIEIARQDQLKNISINNYLPEFIALR